MYADSNADWILKHTRAEAAVGRMAEPVVVTDCSTVGALLQPRFAVSQQREDGSVKLRAIDDFSWGNHGDGLVDSVNGFLVPGEKLKHDTLDAFCGGLRLFVDKVQEIPESYKGDVDAAFRRMPIREDQRWLCGIAFKVEEQVSCLCVAGTDHSLVLQIYVSEHYACPFGAIGSVHAWEGMGDAITHIARWYLKLALFRYVDDFYGPERYGACRVHVLRDIILYAGRSVFNMRWSAWVV